MATKRDRLARNEAAVMRANNRIRSRNPSHWKFESRIAHKRDEFRYRGRRGSRARARNKRVNEAVMRDSQRLLDKYDNLLKSLNPQPSGGDTTNS